MVIPSPAELETLSRVKKADLSKTPFVLLLHAMASHQRSAVLELKRKRVKKTVVLNKGMPVYCVSNLLHETLGQFLVDRGGITEEQRQVCLNKSAPGERMLGETLLAEGLIKPPELYRVLQQTLARKLLHVFAWRTGTLRVLPRPKKVPWPLKVKTAQLIFTGASKFARREEIRAALGPWITKKLFLNPDPPYRLSDIRLTDEQQRVTRILQDGSPIGELIPQTSLSPDNTARLLYVLALIGFVVPEDRLPQRAVPISSRQDTSRPPAMVASEDKSGPDVERVNNDVMGAYLLFRRQDAFDLLGLKEDAPLHEIEKKFMEFSRKFAPAKFETPELAHLLDKVEEMFMAGARAFGQLIDAQRRRALVTQRRLLACGKDKESIVGQLDNEFLDSELAFKKGRAVMRRRMYAQALDLLQFAYECDPQQSKYRAELVYCQYLHSPGEAKKCLEELNETFRIDPECGLAFYYAGLIQGELGYTEEADALLRKGLKMMMPDRRPMEALQALKALSAELRSKRDTTQTSR